mgnify:CR=1 FL=1
MSGPGRPRTRTLKPIISSSTKQNNSMKINRWHYMTEFLRLQYKQIIARFVGDIKFWHEYHL